MTKKIFEFKAIGYIESAYKKKYEAPKQPEINEQSQAKIILEANQNFETALLDLNGFDRIWLIYVFDQNSHWKPKVLPPRLTRKKKGVFSTRSPYRPNPIGMSVVKLINIKGRTLTIEGHDLLDGTAILDIKPYLAYADAFPDASLGWLEEIEEQEYKIEIQNLAAEKLNWLSEQGILFDQEIKKRLSYDPYPHPYRRIKAFDDYYQMSFKEWSCNYTIKDTVIAVYDVYSGFSQNKIKGLEVNNLHDTFNKKFKK